tara:strand:+ start:2993 stop:3637 length:645 start_codon:yes stop_codon:yes gene_type:complete
MAVNEHKNLSSANRHFPKAFEGAQNDTILSKGLGTPGLRDGDLEWIVKSDIKTTKVTFSGYCTLIANYQYPESQIQGQSPYDINQDYGSPTISSGTTIIQKKFFRIGNFSSEQAGVINRATLQVSSPDATGFTVALVKYTPSSSVTDSYPVALIEKSVVGLSNDNKVNTYSLSSSDFALTEMALGDHLFLMVKDDVAAGSVIYATMSMEIGYSK